MTCREDPPLPVPAAFAIFAMFAIFANFEGFKSFHQVAGGHGGGLRPVPFLG
jgi:hypothetical protein